MKKIAITLLAGMMLIGNAAVAADKSAQIPNYKFDKIAHLSCKEAWIQADKSVDKAFAMIETMTVYLLKQRTQQFPDDQEAGNKFGKGIDARCKSDPDQLMLSAVDGSLREVLRP